MSQSEFKPEVRASGEPALIEQIETIAIEVPLVREFKGSHYSMDSRATLITRIYTSSGVVGEIYNGDDPEDQLEVSRIIEQEIAPLLLGTDALLVEKRWETMLPITFDILRNRRHVIMAIAAVDSALWDVVGKVANLPLATVWGGYTHALPIIAIGGYYVETLNELVTEVNDYLTLGIGGCKMKVGGAEPTVDAERFRIMRETGGPDFKLIADANQGYTVAEAIEFYRQIEALDLYWFEEPVRWYNDRLGMRDVRYKTGARVAAGQSEIGRADARDLMADGSIDICNFDASWGGGPTEWRRVAGTASAFGVKMAHHEEPQIAAHLLASIPHGTVLECFHPDRDPIFWEMLDGRGTISDGIYTLPDRPGFGITLDSDFVDKYRVDR